ncbi:hypothetical protein FO519_010564, partial [Halicephalobus sp. NKZ332]
VDAYDISKGKGFCSSILRCTVLFVDPVTESDTYTTILKIPGIENLEDLNTDEGTAYTFDDTKIKGFVFRHQTEIDFYSNLASTLEIPSLKVFKMLPWAPGEYEGVIHMEDMTGKGITTGFYPVLSMGQIKEYVRYYVRMHRISLTGDESHQKLWKGKHDENHQFIASLATQMFEDEEFLDICKDRGRLSFL